MNFSVFADDQTLGDGGVSGSVGGSAAGVKPSGVKPGGVVGGIGGTVPVKEVVLQLKGNTPFYSIYYTNEPSKIKGTLNGKGWNVSQVIEMDSGYGGYGTRTWNIYATVADVFSDSEVVGRCRADLESTMNVAKISIIQEGPTNYIQAAVGANQNDISGGTGGSGFFDNFGLGLGGGLGLSTPIVIAGGVLLLVVLMKR